MIFNKNLICDLDEVYNDVKYFYNSICRFKIICYLFQSPLAFKEINNKIEFSNSSVKGCTKFLKSRNYIILKDNVFHLTSIGYLISFYLHEFFNNFYTIKNLEGFFINHYMDSNLIKFFKNIFILNDAKLVLADNIEFEKPINVYKEYLSTSKELQIIMPIYSDKFLKAILDSLVKNDAFLKLFTTPEILNKIYSTRYKDLFIFLEQADKIDVNYLNNDLKLFYTVADNFVSYFLFFDQYYFDDSSMLIIEEKEKIINEKFFLNYLVDIGLV